MSFPIDRPRRLRRTDAMRRLVRETHLTASDLVQPLFVVPGSGTCHEIPSMPGQFHRSYDLIGEEAARLDNLGVPAVLLFGIPSHKDESGDRKSVV